MDKLTGVTVLHLLLLTVWGTNYGEMWLGIGSHCHVMEIHHSSINAMQVVKWPIEMAAGMRHVTHCCILLCLPLACVI